MRCIACARAASASLFADGSNIFYICSAACCIGICNAFSKTSYTSGDDLSFAFECVKVWRRRRRDGIFVLANRTIYVRLDCFFFFFLFFLNRLAPCAWSAQQQPIASRYAIVCRWVCGAGRMISDRIFLFDKHEQSHMWPSIVYVGRAIIATPPTSSSLIVWACVACLGVDALPPRWWMWNEVYATERAQEMNGNKVTPISLRYSAVSRPQRSQADPVNAVWDVLIWDVLQLSITVTGDASTTYEERIMILQPRRRNMH